MNQCPNCGASTNPQARFCQNCAADLSQYQPTVANLNAGTAAATLACPNCGTTVAPGARFCNACASPLDAGMSYGSGAARANRKPLIIGAIVLAVLLIGGGIATVLLLTGSKPTKERAVQTLRDFYSAYTGGNYDKAASMIYLGKNMTVERVKQDMQGGRSIDLSPKGIDIIAEKGKWGKLDEVFTGDDGRRVRSRVTDAGESADKCYVLQSKSTAVDAVAAFLWDGSQFKILYFDDIQRLEGAQ